MLFYAATDFDAGPMIAALGGTPRDETTPSEPPNNVPAPRTISKKQSHPNLNSLHLSMDTSLRKSGDGSSLNPNTSSPKESPQDPIAPTKSLWWSSKK